MRHEMATTLKVSELEAVNAQAANLQQQLHESREQVSALTIDLETNEELQRLLQTQLETSQ